ncbi:MAG: hypothetical protein P4L31_06105, partial [Candidatus Babeliales bacterium]|nr:hypothetical protein [Candidatus Babeliales bacterium]
MKHKVMPMLLAIIIGITFNCHGSQQATSSISSSGNTLPVHMIIHDDLLPTKALLDLLGKLNVKHNGTLESIKAATQAKDAQWLRPEGKERQECPEVFPSMKDELASCFKALGLIDEIAPSQHFYEHVIVLSNN